ncbi:MAG: TIGR02996 domain-containing protein, partial [Gemmataceae bacterium]
MPPPRLELLALLADVKDHPDDRTPWLVLTDWLEENGGEADVARAEYCRLCLPKMGLGKVTAAHWELGERRRDLYRKWHAAWLGPLAGCAPKQENGLFTVAAGDALTQSLRGYAADPEPFAWVYQVNALDDGIVLGKASPFWAELRSLDLGFGRNGDRVVRYLRAPRFRDLRLLKTDMHYPVTADEADALVQACLAHRRVRLRVRTYGPASDILARLKERLGERL